MTKIDMSRGKDGFRVWAGDPYMSKPLGGSQGFELGGNLSPPAPSFLPLLMAFDLNAIENRTFLQMTSERGKTKLLHHSHSSGGRYDHGTASPPLLYFQFSPLEDVENGRC